MKPCRLIALVMSTGLLVQSPSGIAQDWPMFMGDQAHSGRTVEAGNSDIKKFKLDWTIDSHSEVVTSPVIVGQQLFITAENGNLYCFDLSSKKLLWLFHARGGISSTPAVANGIVYFLSRDGYFYAINTQNGAPVWSFKTQGETVFSAHGMLGMPLTQEPVFDPWDFYLSSALVHQGKVYFGSSDQRVYALDAATGKLAWVFKTGGLIHSSPAFAQNKILIGSWDGALYALDADNGVEQWRFQTEAEQKNSVMLGIQSSPSVDKDTAYLGSRDGYLYAIDLAKGKMKWRYNAEGSWIVGTPAIDEKNIYVGTSDTGLLLALDKQSGKEQYRFETKVMTYSSPLLVGNALFIGSMKAEIFALQATTGKILWSYRSPESKADESQLLNQQGKFDNEKLYGTAQHQLYSALEHVKRLGGYLGSPVWYQGQLIITNTHGQVMGFSDGKNKGGH